MDKAKSRGGNTSKSKGTDSVKPASVTEVKGTESNNPKPLTEYEGTVCSMFRKGHSQVSVPSRICTKYELSFQLHSVRNEAAAKWRQALAGKVLNQTDEVSRTQDNPWLQEGTGQTRDGKSFKLENTLDFAGQCCLIKSLGQAINPPEQSETPRAENEKREERYGPDDCYNVGRPTSSENGSTETNVCDLKSTNGLLDHNRKSSGGGRLADAFTNLEVTSDRKTHRKKVEPWVDLYAAQYEKTCVRKKRIKRLVNHFPLRKTEGYMSLTSILSCAPLRTDSTAAPKVAIEASAAEAIANDIPPGTTEVKNLESSLSVSSVQIYQERSPLQDIFVDIFTGQCIRGYKFGKQLEEGASSIIFLVEKDGKKFVAKVSNRQYSELDKRFKILHHEYKVMKRLEHSHIVKVFEYFVHCQHGVIIMEYMERGELATYAENNWPLPQEELKRIMKDVFKAVRHLQRKHFIHMDIKPNNILMDGQGRVKLADFGGATRVGRFRRNYKMNFFTLEYAPPEKHREEECRKRYLPKHKNYDIWSLGVLFYQLHTADFPFKIGEERTFLSRDDFLRDVSFPEDVDQDMLLLSLIRQCLAIEPEDRIRPKDALSHPFFLLREV